MLNQEGESVWSASRVDGFGYLKEVEGGRETCPFRFQGQYLDVETGLYYNRHRYYDPTAGQYISQDPIGLAGGNPTLYGYVSDSNGWIDPLGLAPLDQPGQAVYGLFKPGASEPYYIGITNNISNRELQHMNSGRLTSGELRTLHSDLIYQQARGMEQFYIEHYGTKTGIIGQEIGPDNQGNKINSFDKNRTDARGVAFKEEYDKFKAEKMKNNKANCD